MARRMTRALITGNPSSEIAIAPASFMAPMGDTLTTALRRARPSLREPRRPRPTHRRLLPPSPTRFPRRPRFRRRPHLLRVDPPPPPRRRNPGVALPERQQIQRPTEVPPRTVRHRQPQLLLQTP